MKSTVQKHSIIVAGHKTSVSLETQFWTRFRGIARDRQITLSELAGQVDQDRGSANLSSAIRVFVLEHALTEAIMYRAMRETLAASTLIGHATTSTNARASA